MRKNNDWGEIEEGRLNLRDKRVRKAAQLEEDEEEEEAQNVFFFFLSKSLKGFWFPSLNPFLFSKIYLISLQISTCYFNSIKLHISIKQKDDIIKFN